MFRTTLRVLVAASAASIVSGEQVQSDVCATISDRVDCSSGVGNPNSDFNMTQQFCEQRGCCFDNTTDASPPCFFPVEGEEVEVVHMINSNHFDAGYADLTVNIANEYFDIYFPLAAVTGAELLHAESSKPGAGPLKWMTFSWLVSLYFDCPIGYGLHCPNETAKKIVADAIEAQDIVWAAFPHNAELATVDESYLKFGVEMSQSLASFFNVSAPNVVSTRDVPGMPRAALKTLHDAGVIGLSEGMNSRIVPVNVPPAFQWRSLDSSVLMPTLWHWHGYGQLGEPGDPIRVPGSKHALAYCWRGDNAGPPLSALEVLNNAKQLQQQFALNNSNAWIYRAGLVSATSKQSPESATRPRSGRHMRYGEFGENVVVKSSTLAEYVATLKEEGSFDKLPVVTEDLSDTWIWGVSSDPLKTQRARSIARARRTCELLKNIDCSASDADYFNFSRLAIKNSEHTWGVSVSHLQDLADKGWSNEEFHEDLAQGNEVLKFLASSWTEQRHHGWDYPRQALPEGHTLRRLLDADMATVAVNNSGLDPIGAGFTVITNLSAPLSDAGAWANVQFHPSGALQSLKDASGVDYASETNLLAALKYQTLILADFEEWQSQYLLPGTGGLNEYGKPPSMMNATPTPVHSTTKAAAKQGWINSNKTQVWVQTTFDDSLVTDYGAPAEAWILYNFETTNKVAVDVVILNKTASRLAEATYVTFNPSLNDGTAQWSHSVLGEWSDPNDIAQGASHGLHYVDDEGVRLQSSNNHTLQVKSLDVGLLRWSDQLPFPTPLGNLSSADLSPGAAFCIHNNIWNTNYPMWYPFEGTADASIRLRFEVVVA